MHDDSIQSLSKVRDNKHLVEDFFNESAYAGHELAWGRIENLAKVAFEQQDRMMILVAEKEGDILGFAMCGMGVVGLKTCQVHASTVVREYRRSIAGGKALIGLLRAVSQWGQKQGAFEIAVSFDEGAVNERFSGCWRSLALV